MTFVRLLLFASISNSAVSMTWRASFTLGSLEHAEQQRVELIVDVNSEDTVLYNREQENGRQLWIGYNTRVSPFYRHTNHTFNHTRKPPLYRVSSKEFGVYAADVMPDYIDKAPNATFALVNRIDVADDPKRQYNAFESGILGLSRGISQLTNFRQFFFRRGTTYCRATECKKTARESNCHGTSITGSESGPDVFKYYNGSIYYTDVKPSALNPAGWSLDAQGFRYGSLKSSRPLRLTLSTTTPYLIVPNSVLSAIHKAVLNGTDYLVDSDMLTEGAPLVFTINGKEVTIPAMDYLDPFGNGKAWLKIRGGASASEWIMGEPFTDAIALCLNYKESLASLYKVPLFPKKVTVRKTSKNFRERREMPDGTVIYEEGRFIN